MLSFFFYSKELRDLSLMSILLPNRGKAEAEEEEYDPSSILVGMERGEGGGPAWSRDFGAIKENSHRVEVRADPALFCRYGGFGVGVGVYGGRVGEGSSIGGCELLQ